MVDYLSLKTHLKSVVAHISHIQEPLAVKYWELEDRKQRMIKKIEEIDAILLSRQKGR